ncbi:hypothetical protein PLESTF_000606400 [Pleodorina starrii]|nr:hypothetical protein PLESTF_000606400 [Pleodorina starrii]
MALARTVLSSRRLSEVSPRALCHTLVARRLRTHPLCPGVRSRERGLRCSPASNELAQLGLSSEDLARVKDVIAKTEATGISESIRVLVTYSGSASAASKLVRNWPNLLTCQLPSWIEFLTAFGLNKVQHVLCQTPEALIEGDLVRAGESLLVFRRLGMDNYQAAQLVTYYPQLLGKEERELRELLSLLSRYQTGVDAVESLTDVRQG